MSSQQSLSTSNTTAHSRQYDIVLLGATGYTGVLTAEYLHLHLPSNYKWAIAGRSGSKLKDVTSTLTSLDSSRPLPQILPVNLEASELSELAQKTRLIINCIGPYHQYSTPVVKACAESGTHYLDVTGETVWVREIITKFEATAQKTGAIIIPECGVESAPSDILAYVATRLVRDVWDCGVMDVVGSVHELKSTGPSGGTLATVIGLLDHYSLREVRKCFSNPFCLSPIQDRDLRLTKHPIPTSYERTIFQKLFGVWSYPYLGTLTTSITAQPNVAIVHRSAGIMQSFYSYNFTYEEYMRVSNAFLGTMIHFALAFFSVALAIPPVRTLARAIATAPGSGPSRDASKNDVLEMRGVAIAEQLNERQRKAFASVRFENASLYSATAMLVAEAAVALLEGKDDLLKKFGPGFLTPACLGDRYVDRLEKAGVKIVVKQIGDDGSK